PRVLRPVRPHPAHRRRPDPHLPLRHQRVRPARRAARGQRRGRGRGPVPGRGRPQAVGPPDQRSPIRPTTAWHVPERRLTATDRQVGALKDSGTLHPFRHNDPAPRASVSNRHDDRGGAVAPECTFCQIVSGELPAEYVFEDDRTVAFMDINPATAGHPLVVPSPHARDVMSADVSDWTAVALTAQRMARWVTGALGAGGVDLVQANSDGKVGAQTVFHLHVHVLPRYPGDNLGPWWTQQTADPHGITRAAEGLIAHGPRDL